MKRKTKFRKTVQIRATGGKFIFKTAQRVPEQCLRIAPGGAARELVVAQEKLMPPANHDYCAQNGTEAECATHAGELSMSHALRIQSAHYWLELGDVDQALLELGALSTKACSHPLAVKARVAVLRAARKLNEITVQE